MTSEFQTLKEGLASLDLKVPETLLEKFIGYLTLLERWNATINLTAIRDRQRMVPLHILDSLTVIPWLTGRKNLLDVGTGAGLPGIPIALILPQLRVTLLESNQKKVAFLRQCKLELNLNNVSIVGERVEQWTPELPYDTIISRAFSDLPEYVLSTRHLLEEGGELLAMKGTIPYDEINRLPADVVTKITPLHIPGLTAERHLIQISTLI
ncbi:MAG: 16S rRNA (guanine(527)-N(7))-methyltransferase RsmG [Ferrovum sp.]|nr:16S rRNA (guanine(527)-N(7))-methyltransferase RsmG [Ferrovum sp.]